MTGISDGRLATTACPTSSSAPGWLGIGNIGGSDVSVLSAQLTDPIAARISDGHQVILVSSGAIATGITPLGLKMRPKDLASQRAAASVGQGLLIARYTGAFARYGLGVGQVLLTADDLMRRAHYRNAQRTLERLLELNFIPIINENDTVATDEIRFGDNDRLAALVAHVSRASALILLSDVDGLYDGDPRNGRARRIDVVNGPQDQENVKVGKTGASGLGRGGMSTKVESPSARMRTATSAGRSKPSVAALAWTVRTVMSSSSAGKGCLSVHPCRSITVFAASATSGNGRS